MSGFFLAFEGVDGSGKTTQVDRLERFFVEQGRKPLRVREPGGTPLGESIREILLMRGDLEFGAEAELLLFLASRVELYDGVIAPALAAGRVVISDRYHLSTLVYQGMARGLGEERVAGLLGEILGDRRPHLQLVIEVPFAECQKRLGDSRDRIESDNSMLARVVDGFRTTRGLPGDQIVRIDGCGTADEVAARVREAVEQHAL